MSAIGLILLFFAAFAWGQEDCRQPVQVCSPILNPPSGFEHPAASGPKQIIQLKKELEKITKRVSILSEEQNSKKEANRCPLSSYTFPRGRQVTDFARYRRYVPRLTSATACMWVNGSDFSHGFGFGLLSYATSGRDNDFLMFYLTRTHAMGFNVANSRADLPFTLSQGVMTHICNWFDSRRSRVGMYVNGIAAGEASYSGNVMSGGGSLMLGHDQDAVASRLDAEQAFSGTIENAMMWPRVLSASEVANIAEDCVCPPDYVIAMTIDKMEVAGATKFEVPTTCYVTR